MTENSRATGHNEANLDTDNGYKSIGSSLRGYQVTKAFERKKKFSPDWALDDNKVKDLLLLCFPKSQTSSSQRKSAGRWALVINYYFKLNYTAPQTAQEMSVKTHIVDSIIARIHKALSGLTSNSRERKGARGRPRKNSDSI